MITSPLLQRLLQMLGMAHDVPGLDAAVLRADKTLPEVQPGDRVRFILTQAQIKGVQVIQLGWRRFDLRRLPVLLQYRGDWFIAEKKSGDQVTLIDAQNQPQDIAESDLQDCLVVCLRVPAQRSRGGTSPLAANRAAQLIWEELFRDRAWVGKVFVATVVVNVLAIASSLFTMQVYDRVVPTMAFATLTTLVAGMLLILALDWSLKSVRARILDSLSVAVDKRVSQRVFDHLLHLRLDKQPKSLGTLAAQVGGLESVRQFFSAGVVFSLVDLPFALLFIVFIAIIGGPLAWVYLLLLLVALALGLLSQKRLQSLLRKQVVRSNERQGVLVDAIRGAESIRAGNATWRFSEEWQAITASIDSYHIEQKAINSATANATGGLSTLAYVAAIVVGVWQIEAGLLTTGGLVACSILGGRVIAPVAQAVNYLTQWQGVKQSLEMVHQVLVLDLERRPDQTLLVPEQAPESIELDQLRFSYPESPVQHIRIKRLGFKSGERVLLLGPVGCGKSTLLKIIAGLYPPGEGRVRLGDADLWEIDPQVVASQVGYLPQSVHLFKGTLRSNLTLSGTVGDSRLLKITRELGVDAIAASSAQGMDLVISEGGEGLSGGQRQLVALARVVINQPRIWLLDEPTASLDSENEARVWHVLASNLRPEDILIVATHRPMQAMKLATRLVVMQQGEVVMDGTPQDVQAQLMANAPRAAVAAAKPLDGGNAHVA